MAKTQIYETLGELRDAIDEMIRLLGSETPVACRRFGDDGSWNDEFDPGVIVERVAVTVGTSRIAGDDFHGFTTRGVVLA